MKIFGKGSKKGSVDYIMGILFLALIASALVPTIFSSIKDANQTGWTASEIAMWAIIPIIIIIGIVYRFYKGSGAGGM